MCSWSVGSWRSVLRVWQRILLVEEARVVNGIVLGLNRDTHHVKRRQSLQFEKGKVDERP